MKKGSDTPVGMASEPLIKETFNVKEYDSDQWLRNSAIRPAFVFLTWFI